jgi:hypothetical protein
MTKKTYEAPALVKREKLDRIAADCPVSTCVWAMLVRLAWAHAERSGQAPHKARFRALLRIMRTQMTKKTYEAPALVKREKLDRIAAVACSNCIPWSTSRSDAHYGRLIAYGSTARAPAPSFKLYAAPTTRHLIARARPRRQIKRGKTSLAPGLRIASTRALNGPRSKMHAQGCKIADNTIVDWMMVRMLK